MTLHEYIERFGATARGIVQHPEIVELALDAFDDSLTAPHRHAALTILRDLDPSDPSLAWIAPRLARRVDDREADDLDEGGRVYGSWSSGIIACDVIERMLDLASDLDVVVERMVAVLRRSERVRERRHPGAQGLLRRIGPRLADHDSFLSYVGEELGGWEASYRPWCRLSNEDLTKARIAPSISAADAGGTIVAQQDRLDGVMALVAAASPLPPRAHALFPLLVRGVATELPAVEERRVPRHLSDAIEAIIGNSALITSYPGALVVFSRMTIECQERGDRYEMLQKSIGSFVRTLGAYPGRLPIVRDLLDQDDDAALCFVLDVFAFDGAAMASDDRVTARLLELKLTHAFAPYRVLAGSPYDASWEGIGGIAWWALQEVVGLAEAQRRARAALPALLVRAMRLRLRKSLGFVSQSGPAFESPRPLSFDAEDRPHIPSRFHSWCRHVVARTTGITVTFLGWVLVLAGGMVAFDSPRGPWFTTTWLINRALVVAAVIAGRQLVVLGRRLSPGDGWFRILSRPTEIILYLRSFQDDATADETVYRNQFFALFAPRRTIEEDVVRALDPLGSVVTIARPNEQLPPTGAARVRMNGLDWQRSVLALMASARLVVIHVGYGANLQSEMAWARRVLRPERLLLYVPSSRWREFVAAYDESIAFASFLKELAHTHMDVESDWSRLSGCPLVAFGPDWQPIPLWSPANGVGYFGASRIGELRIALGRLYDRFGVSMIRMRARKVLYAVAVLVTAVALLGFLAVRFPTLGLD